MFEKDKNKGILMRKRNAQHYFTKQPQFETLVCAKFAHLLLYLKHIFQNTSTLVWLVMASISSAISADVSLM